MLVPFGDPGWEIIYDTLHAHYICWRKNHWFARILRDEYGGEWMWTGGTPPASVFKAINDFEIVRVVTAKMIT